MFDIHTCVRHRQEACQTPDSQSSVQPGHSEAAPQLPDQFWLHESTEPKNRHISTLRLATTSSFYSVSHHLALIDVEWFQERRLRCEQALQGSVILSQALN